MKYRIDKKNITFFEELAKGPFIDDYAETRAEQMIAHSDPTKLSTVQYKYGSPTSRKEFDAFYKADPEARKMIRDFAHVEITKDLMETKALWSATEVKATLLPIAKALEKHGIDPNHYIKETTRNLLMPGDFDISRIDNDALSKGERRYVQFTALVSRIISKHGLLKSTAADAPEDSKWVEWVAEEAAAKMKAAMSSLRGK